MACKYYYDNRSFNTPEEILGYMKKMNEYSSRPIKDGVPFQKVEGNRNTNPVFHKYFGPQGLDTNAFDLLNTLKEQGESEHIRQMAASILESLGEDARSIPVVLEDLADWQTGTTVLTKQGAMVRMQNGTWSNNEDFETTILHELVHAATMGFIRNNPGHKSVTDLLDAQMDILRDVQEGRIEFDVMGVFGDGHSTLLYALTGQKVRSIDEVDMDNIDPVEMMSFALTESSFRDFLKQAYPPQSKKSWWQRIMDSIRTFLGINNPSRINSPMLERLSNAAEKVMRTAREHSENMDDYDGPTEAARPQSIPARDQRTVAVEEQLKNNNKDESFRVIYGLLKGHKFQGSPKVYDGLDRRRINHLFSAQGDMDFDNFVQRTGLEEKQVMQLLHDQASNKAAQLGFLESVLGIDASQVINKAQIDRKGKKAQYDIDQTNKNPIEVSDEVKAERIQRVNDQAYSEAIDGPRTATKAVLHELSKNMDKKDAYGRHTRISNDSRVTFEAGEVSVAELVAKKQEKWKATHQHKIITHPSKVTQRNDEVRKQLFGENAEKIQVGEIMLMNGQMVEVKSIDPSFQTQVMNKSGELITLSGYELTATNNKTYRIITGHDTSANSMEEVMERVDDPKALNAEHYFMEDPGIEGYNPATYGYALSPDMVGDNSFFSAVIDENSFIYGEKENVSRNTMLSQAFGSSNNITVYSSRKADPVNPAENDTQGDEDADNEVEEVLKNILDTDGTLERSHLGPEYTKTARDFAVDGMVDILQTGAIAVTSEQIRNTEGLPAGLSTMPYFAHEGKIYINKDMVGQGQVMKELKHLFLLHVKTTNEPLFKELMKLTMDWPGYEDIRKSKPDATEEEVQIAAFQVLSEQLRPQLNTFGQDEFQGTLNEFVNAVDKELKDIDPSLNRKSQLEHLALVINKGVHDGRLKLHRMLLQPDVEAARFATGEGGLAMQMDQLTKEMIMNGKLIKTCE